MFGEDDEDDLDLALDDEEFGAWSSRAPSSTTLNAARAFANSIGLGDDQISVGDPVGHWLIDFRSNPDVQQLQEAANTIANRYQVRWVHLDDRSGNVHFWLFLPR